LIGNSGPPSLAKAISVFQSESAVEPEKNAPAIRFSLRFPIRQTDAGSIGLMLAELGRFV